MASKWSKWLADEYITLLGDEVPAEIVATAESYMTDPQAGEDGAIGATWTDPFERRLIFRYWGLLMGIVASNGWRIDGQRRVVDVDGMVLADDVEEVAEFCGLKLSQLTLTAPLPGALRRPRRWTGAVASVAAACGPAVLHLMGG